MSEYVQRAVNKDGHEMYSRVHISDGNKTACGIVLNDMWFITGDSDKIKKDVTCQKCKKGLISGNQRNA